MQWQIGYTSLLYHAVGVSPFKDNFWSSDEFVATIFYHILFVFAKCSLFRGYFHKRAARMPKALSLWMQGAQRRASNTCGSSEHCSCGAK